MNTGKLEAIPAIITAKSFSKKKVKKPKKMETFSVFMQYFIPGGQDVLDYLNSKKKIAKRGGKNEITTVVESSANQVQNTTCLP